MLLCSIFFLDYTEWAKWGSCKDSPHCGHTANRTRERNCTHNGVIMDDEICLQLNETWSINETRDCYNKNMPCYSKQEFELILLNYLVNFHSRRRYRRHSNINIFNTLCFWRTQKTFFYLQVWIEPYIDGFVMLIFMGLFIIVHSISSILCPNLLKI